MRTSPKPTSRKSPQPKFIDNIYMDNHSKTSATANAIQPKKLLEKTKIQKLQHTDPQLIAANTSRETYIKGSYPVKNIPLPAHESYSNEQANAISEKYAEILSISPKEISNLALYRFIDKWYGTNYRMGGCDQSGIDCSGFAQKLYADVYGVDLVRTSIDQFKSCKRIKHIKDATEGDLIFFCINNKRHISHVGIYLANNYFVHASTTNGVMISNLNEDYYQSTFAGIGRVPKG